MTLDKSKRSEFYQENHFFIDSSRCIGCQACVQACGECYTHRGTPMIHLEYVDRAEGVQTAPVVCMHCEDPTCAKVCPADAIKQDEDGIVHSAAKPRCVSCNNCVYGCPFGVPKMPDRIELMMKCDMCYDRTSEGKRPMCATVCPSEALYFGTMDSIREKRNEEPVNEFHFGQQVVKTKVYMMTKKASDPIKMDISDYLKPGTDSVEEDTNPSRSGAPDVADFAAWDDLLV